MNSFKSSNDRYESINSDIESDWESNNINDTSTLIHRINYTNNNNNNNNNNRPSNLNAASNLLTSESNSSHGIIFTVLIIIIILLVVVIYWLFHLLASNGISLSSAVFSPAPSTSSRLNYLVDSLNIDENQFIENNKNLHYNNAGGSNINNKNDKFELPILNRNIYIIIAQGQAQLNTYVYQSLPSVLADVAIFCWSEACEQPKSAAAELATSKTLFTSYWTENRQIRYSQPLISLTNNTEFPILAVQPKLFIVNEADIGVKTTWTTARNIMLDYIQKIEQKRGWRYAYQTLVDDDMHLTCPRIAAVMTNNLTAYPNFNPPYLNQLMEVTKIHHDHWIHIYFRTMLDGNNRSPQGDNEHEAKCYIGNDVFLLIASPAVGAIKGLNFMDAPPLENHPQMGHHVDAQFNSFHADVIPTVLPYCTRFDSVTWWSSQAYLTYRLTCIFGHLLINNELWSNHDQESHRPYPRSGQSWHVVTENLSELQIIDSINPKFRHIDELRNYLGGGNNFHPVSLETYVKNIFIHSSINNLLISR